MESATLVLSHNLLDLIGLFHAVSPEREGTPCGVPSPSRLSLGTETRSGLNADQRLSAEHIVADQVVPAD